MGRILLSQSQVSVVISSTVVIVFTFVLFLSGYILQQQSVTGLQQALKPRIPQPPPPQASDQHAAPELQSSSRLFAGRLPSSGLSTNVVKDINWRRLAHVQLARNHHDVCNAIMVLADLHRMKSPARRVLLFPQHWATEEEGSGKGVFFEDPFMASSRRLLRLAARRYAVELRPISPIREKQADVEEDMYSLASAFALTEFDRVLHVETPGMLLDATPLDALLAFSESAPFSILQAADDGSEVHSEDVLLLEPSDQVLADLTERLPQGSSFNDTLLPSLFDSPKLLSPSSDDYTLVRSVGSLHAADSDFNQTAYLSNLAYIRFSDPKLPGPEYDVPWSQKVAARPKHKDADWVWTKMYGQFSQRRMEVCGLDLETWRQ